MVRNALNRTMPRSGNRKKVLPAIFCYPINSFKSGLSNRVTEVTEGIVTFIIYVFRGWGISKLHPNSSYCKISKIFCYPLLPAFGSMSCGLFLSVTNLLLLLPNQHLKNDKQLKN